MQGLIGAPGNSWGGEVAGGRTCGVPLRGPDFVMVVQPAGDAAGRRDREQRWRMEAAGHRSGGARRGEIEEAENEELARDPFRIIFYRNLCYDTVSTYVTVTLSLFFNSLPCHHFC